MPPSASSNPASAGSQDHMGPKDPGPAVSDEYEVDSGSMTDADAEPDTVELVQEVLDLQETLPAIEDEEQSEENTPDRQMIGEVSASIPSSPHFAIYEREESGEIGALFEEARGVARKNE